MKKAVAKWLEEYKAFTAENPERKESFETRSGIPIKPLYTSADLEDLSEERDLGFPGQYPFTRGIYPTMYRGHLWTKRFVVGLQTAEVYNRRQRELIEAGQTGLNLIPCNASIRGYDSDMVERELLGRCGVIIDSLGDMEAALEGIPFDRVSTALNDCGPFALVAMYIAMAQKQGIPLSQLQGTTNQGDFIDHFIASNLFFRFGLEGHLRLLIDHIKYCTQHMPRWHPVSIKGGDMHEAGSTPIQEVAFTLATGIFYASEAIKAGLEIDDFAPRFSFYYQVGNELFEEVARLRAARRMWTTIMRERFGAQDPRSCQFRVFVQTSGVALSPRQILNNISRATIHTLAAVLGGAQAIHTDAYDEAWWSPSEQAQRVALMTQNIIAEETGVADVIDPLGGSYYVEYLTKEVERRAWGYIEKIDALGGMLEATKKGYIQTEIAREASKYQREVEAGKRVIVGMNKYVVPEEEVPSQQLKVDGRLIEEQIERTGRLRRERDQRKAWEALQDVRRIAEGGEGNIFEAVIEAVKAEVTNGEIVRELREVYGFGRPLDIMAVIP